MSKILIDEDTVTRALELLAVATFIAPKLQAERTDVINAGLKALAEQPAQQEPVAWMTQARNFVHLLEFTEAQAKLYGWKAVYTSPPAQQCKWPTCQSEEAQQALAEQIKRELVGEQPVQQEEPVAILNHAHGVYAFRGVKLKGLPDGEYDLYTTPQPAQRTWVAVSDRLPLESDGEVLVRMRDGRCEIAWATYWHGASNAFSQWTFRDPDEDEAPTHWMHIPAIEAAHNIKENT